MKYSFCQDLVFWNWNPFACLFSDWEGAVNPKSPIKEEHIARLEGEENFEEWLHGQNSIYKWGESAIIFIWTSVVYWVY